MKHRLPLHNWHTTNEARFIEDPSGYMVPSIYGKVDREYSNLRQGVGIVDLCHESRLRVEADDPIGYLNELLTVDVEALKPGEATYGYLCNDRGGIIDGMTVYNDRGAYILLGNGAARERVLAWMQKYADEHDQYAAVVIDTSDTQGLLGIRGPQAGAMMTRAAMSSTVQVPQKGFAAVLPFGNIRALVVHKPYDPIDSFDILIGNLHLQPLWDQLNEIGRTMGATPVGQTVMEIVRVESGFARVGKEIDEETTPLEINQTSRIDFTKRRFLGRRALLHSSSSEFTRSLVTMKLASEGPVGPDCEILCDRIPVGRLTSVVTSPYLKSRVALGYVNSLKANPGTMLQIASGGDVFVMAEVMRPLTASLGR